MYVGSAAKWGQVLASFDSEDKLIFDKDTQNIIATTSGSECTSIRDGPWYGDGAPGSFLNDG